MSDYKIELSDELGNRQFPVTLTNCISDEAGVNLNTILNEKSRIVHLKVPVFSYLEFLDDNGEELQEPTEYILQEINSFYTPEVIAYNNSYFSDGVFNLEELKNDIIVCNDYYVGFGCQNSYFEMFQLATSGEWEEALVAALECYENLPILIYIPKHLPFDAPVLFSSDDDLENILEIILFMLIYTILGAGIGVYFYIDSSDVNALEYPDVFNMVIDVWSPWSGALTDDMSNHVVCVVGDLYSGAEVGTFYASNATYRYFSRNINKYEDIRDAALCGALIPGNEYIIKDYQTIVDSSYGIESDENNYMELIVKAKDPFTLEEDAVIRKNYDFREWTDDTKSCNITKVKYSLENNKILYPWVIEDSYLETEQTYFGVTKFYETPLLIKNDDGTVLRGWRIWSAKAPLLAKILGTLWVPENIKVGETFIEPFDNTQLTVKNIVKQDHSSKGFVYEMTDCYGNQAPWDFTSLRFKVNNDNFANGNGVWFPTFCCTDFDDWNLYVRGNMQGTDYFQFTNNKITDVPKGSKVVICAKKGATSLKDITINSGNIIASIPNYSTIEKDCDNLAIADTSETNPIIKVLPGTKTEGQLVIKDDFGKISNNLVYVGKNSQGEIKMFNPIDLII